MPTRDEQIRRLRTTLLLVVQEWWRLKDYYEPIGSRDAAPWFIDDAMLLLELTKAEDER